VELLHLIRQVAVEEQEPLELLVLQEDQQEQVVLGQQIQ
tara:strand:- start:87 stop:203 length:117 start_codon:yes stop_codon:yes gene_type:complete